MPTASDIASEAALAFRARIEHLSGQTVSSCYQCGKCTAGCPVASEMDTDPARVMRLVQLGARERVLRDEAIWLCASCETCVSRCPQACRLPRVMDALRAVAEQDGYARDNRGAALLNRLFLAQIRAFGRVHEMSLVAGFNLASRRPLRDVTKGPSMMRKGKLHLLPQRSANLPAVRRIFERVQELEGSET